MGWPVIESEGYDYPNYERITRADLEDGGRAIRFRVLCGVEYVVQTEDLITWYKGPYYFCSENGLRRWKAKYSYDGSAKKAIRCRVVTRYESFGLRRDYAHIYMQGGAVFVVSGEDLIVTLEPGYQFFGGWAEKSYQFSRKRILAGTSWAVILKDTAITPKNFGTYRKCRVDDMGRTLVFVMACGDIYRVPASEALKWPALTRGTSTRGSSNGARSRRAASKCKPLRCRRINDNTCVRIYLDDGSSCDIGCRDLLTNYDERYEGYKGRRSSRSQLIRQLCQLRLRNVAMF